MKWRFIGPFVLEHSHLHWTKCASHSHQPKSNGKSIRDHDSQHKSDFFSFFSLSLSLSVLHIFEHICQSVEANWDSMFDAITQNSSDFVVVVVVVVIVVVVFDLKRLTGTRHEYPGVSRLCLHPDCKQLLFVHLIARREICHKVINIVFVLYV